MTRETILICDRCDAELRGSHHNENQRQRLYVELREGTALAARPDSGALVCHVELCEACSDELRKFLTKPPRSEKS